MKNHSCLWNSRRDEGFDELFFVKSTQGALHKPRDLAFVENMHMCFLVFVGKRIKDVEKPLLFLERIRGLHHQPKTIEPVFIPGPFALGNDWTQMRGQFGYWFRGHHDEQPSTDAQFAIGRAAFDCGTAVTKFDVAKDVIWAIAPDDLANKPGHCLYIDNRLFFHKSNNAQSGRSVSLFSRPVTRARHG